MISSNKPTKNAGLWWVAIVALSIGLSIFFLLKPAAANDPQIQSYRAMALVACIMISGLCIIIGTQKRWFGKDL